jgi:hypothetical protein
MNTLDKLDRILRRDAAEAIADGGFAARVMAALPAPQPRLATGLNPVLVTGSAALGSVLAVIFAPSEANVVQGMIDLFLRQMLTPAAYASMGLAATLLVSAVLLARES